MVKAASATPSFSRLFHKNTSFPYKKVLTPPYRGARTEIQFLRYHLACRRYSDRLMTAPTRRLPVNAGIASEDTEDDARSLCPRRPICCSAFRPALSSAGLSVDALATLLPRPWFMLYNAYYTPKVSVCQALFSARGGIVFAVDWEKQQSDKMEFSGLCPSGQWTVDSGQLRSPFGTI